MCYMQRGYDLTEHLASTLCGSTMNGTLVSIANSQEHDFVSRTLNPSGQYWIGLQTNRERGKFEWVDGSAVTFSQWDSYEPRLNETSDGRVCVSMKNKSGQFVWQAVNCNVFAKPICKGQYSMSLYLIVISNITVPPAIPLVAPSKAPLPTLSPGVSKLLAFHVGCQ